ncbi:MAG TPA: hypothetical protein VGM11_05165 [Acidobacteriaceae bacterium]|jgi:hypothetical protein
MAVRRNSFCGARKPCRESNASPRKLERMDRVKFGRALGYGARHAAKTLAQAVDAASTPNPASRSSNAASPSSQPRPAAPPFRVPDPQTVRAAGRQAKSSLSAPIVRFSSVIWLQVTGIFFALVAFTMGTAAWRARAGLHASAGSSGALKLYAYAAVCGLFIYFTVSSFVRAARR